MSPFLFAGAVHLPWWGYALVALGLTHVTIVAVTLYLHRHQTHHALDLHPAVSHFFRLWLWLTTGMRTREWVAVHRKHHARCETAEDPHSPQVLGINRVLWGGVFLYVEASADPDTIERFGRGTPDDWLERNVYAKYVVTGLTLMGLADVLLFGAVPGALILATQIVWIPFWAAGVINGVGHWFGYRNWATEDASTNMVPLGALIGGEELHNNHHAHATSARFSSKRWEFDLGWFYIRVLQALGLARVRHLAPVPGFVDARPVADLQLLQAVIEHRHDVIARYLESMKRIYAGELSALRESAPHDARVLRNLHRWLFRDERNLVQFQRIEVEKGLLISAPLRTTYVMRRELASLWARSMASQEQLVRQLQDWCRRAEASGIGPLEEFSQRLRRYA